MAFGFAEVLADLGVSLGSLRAIILSTFRAAGSTGWVGEPPLTSPIRGHFSTVPSLSRLQRLWYRYPGRWIFPLVAWFDCSVPGTKGRVGWISGIPRADQGIGGWIMEARRQAVSDVLQPRVPVGTEWTASVVVVRRGPEDFAKAYEELKLLAAKVGVDLDDARVSVESVQTDQGPGLRLTVSQRLDESPDD